MRRELELQGRSASSALRGVWQRHGPPARHGRLLRLEKTT